MSDKDSRQPLSNSRERAAFHVSIHSLEDEGTVVWETRAYHEESDTAISWPGPPGEDLVQWLRVIAGLPGESEPASEASLETALPAQEASHDAPPARADVGEPSPAEPELNGAIDDFTQIIGISAATERQLHAAGIRTYADLAARTPAELGELLSLPPERISRRGWITRARALARLASLPSTQPAPPPASETEAPLGGQAGAMLWIEVLFDEEGAILEQRLLREGEPPAPQPDHDEAVVARFFVEAPPVGMLEAMQLELSCELDDLELEEIPGGGPEQPPRLRARSILRIMGLGAEQARRERIGYLAYVLAHELTTGATAVLHGAPGRLDPEVDEEPITLEFELPEIGRYQMLLVVLLADGIALSSVAGPRLRVNP